MILTKQKSANAGPSNGTGEGVAYSKRWYVALVRMHHEKKVSEYLDKMSVEIKWGLRISFRFSRNFINGVTDARWSSLYCFQ